MDAKTKEDVIKTDEYIFQILSKAKKQIKNYETIVSSPNILIKEEENPYKNYNWERPLSISLLK